ncbi:MAG TPA: POTRA domain-containing protein [Polyangiaceae bacterium]|nr:POTRA domain-containing protein [Polyangiaceae bacterium]
MRLGQMPLIWVLAAVFSLLSPRVALAADSDASLVLQSAPDLSPYLGQPITRIQVLTEGGRWTATPRIEHARIGQLLSADLVRRVLAELGDSGRFADLRASVDAEVGGVRLTIRVVPRRLIANIRITAGGLEQDDVLRVANVHQGGALTAVELRELQGRVMALYVRRGYAQARVTIETVDTDDPASIVLTIDAIAGPPRTISARRFGVWPDPQADGMAEALSGYALGTGDRANEDALTDADRALEADLKTRGFHRAKVSHQLSGAQGATTLEVKVYAYSKVRFRFEGNRHFDAGQLENVLDVESASDLSPAALTEKITTFYRQHGFFDAEVRYSERGRVEDPIQDIVFVVREGALVHVVAREYPCLTGARTPAQVGSEIDSFLSELPGGRILDAVDPAVLDSLQGPTEGTGKRIAPDQLSPWAVYDPDVYDRALKHVQDLYRSEGYLSASVGPVQVLRRACSVRSPAGQCLPVGPARRPPTACRYDAIGLPLSDAAPDPRLSCVPDPKHGVKCEPSLVLHVPVKVGPRATLYDLGFEGNRVIVEKDLQSIADLRLGTAVSQVEIEKARRRVLDEYAERGFAFAEAETALDLSLDHTRARVRFILSEREQVRVSRIVVRGANRTKESLIRTRIALEVGGLYQRSLVRKTEERLATLGVFSSVNVGFEDPYVPAREKVVVVGIEERVPQYLDVRPGFSTGEGARVSFEYGHRNLSGQAISLTLRAQLGYLPTAFILEDDVKQKYSELSVGERLERRNTATVVFPNIGLGPLFRLSIEGVDLRDNARDYGITKDAGIVTLSYRPDRRFSVQIGPSVERNYSQIFGNDQKNALKCYLQDHKAQQALFRVPQGLSRVLAQRVGVTWDRRDNPLNATSGTFLSAGVEHVNSIPLDSKPPSQDTGCVGAGQNPGGETIDPFQAVRSDFLRYTNRVAGYVRLSDKGLALALSFRWGVIQHLIPGSQTYPDRLFFLGGVDTLRGFLQDSLVPQDIAKRLLDPSSGLTIRDVVIRGGDIFLNPRAELRIPVGSSVETALFLDAGNLWTDPARVNAFELRYAVGTGLRIATPIGPLVFDYGFNVDRVLDEMFPNRDNKRYWEDIGAFHFSIGLY